MIDTKTLARFWAKVNKLGPVPAHVPDLGPCWVWTAHQQPNCYGQFGLYQLGCKLAYAHRVSFLIEHGRWATPCTLHKCDNRACVRPSHLFEGSRAENMADAKAKGRTASGAALGPRHGEFNATAKLNDDLVRAIRAAAARGEPQRAIARQFGTAQANVSDIVTRKRWSHVA
jgi:hypothetical protein